MVGVRPESATHGLYLTQVIADDGKNYFQASLGVLEWGSVTHGAIDWWLSFQQIPRCRHIDHLVHMLIHTFRMPFRIRMGPEGCDVWRAAPDFESLHAAKVPGGYAEAPGDPGVSEGVQEMAPFRWETGCEVSIRQGSWFRKGNDLIQKPCQSAQVWPAQPAWPKQGGLQPGILYMFRQV